MSLALNPIHQIRESCGRVSNQATEVTIDAEALSKAANDLFTTDFDAMRDGVAWDVCGWHYCKDAPTNGPLTCQYVFVMDALNFCFWPCPGFEVQTCHHG